MNAESIKRDWRSRGYNFGTFQDPPNRVWADFVHKTDELVVLAEGEIEMRIPATMIRPTAPTKAQLEEHLPLHLNYRS